MNTLRHTVESFLYPHLEYFTELVYREGEDARFMGIPVLDDSAKFVHGALVNAAAILYAHYSRKGDTRAHAVLQRLIYFMRLATSDVCKTWGKLAILRALNTLSSVDALDAIPDDLIKVLREKTDYSDFFDKSTMALRGMATNYLQVAMACAGYREKLGWENDGTAGKIASVLEGVLVKSDLGWMDDEIPFGRFDRYTIILASEFADTAKDTGIELPETVKRNLRDALDAVLFMKNKDGDGILYGRSVACHADAVSLEVIASAFAAGLVDESERKDALAYSFAALKKITSFWYDRGRRSFNIWWDGRSTNDYRAEDRVLEVNLDMAAHLYTTLKNFERAGIADEVIDPDIALSEKWAAHEVAFKRNKEDKKSLFIIRRNGLMMQIPFVGLGEEYGRRAAYYPFPAIARVIEINPMSELAFMVPEYMDKDGNKYRPVQYFDSLELTDTDGVITIRAGGFLSLANGNIPSKSNIRFSSLYEIAEDTVSVRFSLESDQLSAEMITGKLCEDAVITVYGFDSTNIFPSDVGRVPAINGYLSDLKRHCASSSRELEYTIKLPRRKIR